MSSSLSPSKEDEMNTKFGSIILARLLFSRRHRTKLYVLLAFVGLYLYQQQRQWSDLSSVDFVALGDAARHAAFRADPYTNTSNQQQNNTEHVTTSKLPIHILQPSTNHSSVLLWRTLANTWDRHLTFDNLTEISSSLSLSSFLPPMPPPDKELAIILHLSPKMGSMTLRKACRAELKNSCGMEPKGKIDPNGYSRSSELGEIVRECNSKSKNHTTHHFCLRRGMFPKSTAPFQNTVFFHLYPFRHYDSWTVSALKQSFHRGGMRECKRAASYVNECDDKQMAELAFFKYPKTKMSEAFPALVHRVNEMGERHHVLLHPHSEIDGLLNVLSEVYGIPLLPGSNETDHEKRKNGTCDSAILDKFHECFTWKLGQLP